MLIFSLGDLKRSNSVGGDPTEKSSKRVGRDYAFLFLLLPTTSFFTVCHLSLMSRVYFTYYLLFHILYLVKAQQQQPFFYPAPSPLTQSLSLKHFYHLDTQSNSSLLYRYEKRPRRAASLAHRPLDGAADDKSTANYMIQSSIERYSKPSQSSIDYLIHSTATRTRWQTVPQAQTTMESVLGLVPNVTDHATILTLAKMSYDAYTGIGGDDWYDLDKKQWATVRKSERQIGKGNLLSVIIVERYLWLDRGWDAWPCV